MKHSTEYQAGYNDALKEINTPRLMITENWNPSQCPRCKEYLDEECDDGYYKRWYSLERCPNCGQSVKWE